MELFDTIAILISTGLGSYIMIRLVEAEARRLNNKKEESEVA